MDEAFRGVYGRDFAGLQRQAMERCGNGTAAEGGQRNPTIQARVLGRTSGLSARPSLADG